MVRFVLISGVFAGSVLAADCALAVPANDISGSVGVNGTVADRCIFNSPSTVNLDIGQMVNTTGPDIGRFDATTLTSRSATLNGFCASTSSTMTVEALPMLNTSVGSPPSGFAVRVDYTASATASPSGGDVTISDASDVAGPSAPSTVGAFSGDIDVTFSSPSVASNFRLVAGSYSGSVVVTLAPGT